MKLFFRFICIAFLSPIVCFSQETVVTAGGDVESSDGFISYSIGQVFYVTIEDESYSVGQGIQHAYDVGTEETTPENFSYQAVVRDANLEHIDELEDNLAAEVTRSTNISTIVSDITAE